MQPRPTNRPGLLSVPGPGLTALNIRFAKLSDRDHLCPRRGLSTRSVRMPRFLAGGNSISTALALADGVYEYEFLANGNVVVADPYADAITRFGGYRGRFTISDGVRVSPSFSWDDEFPAGTTLPQNNQIVIYEMPIKWMSSDPSENPLVELGTFDKVIFEHLDDLVAMGINCIETPADRRYPSDPELGVRHAILLRARLRYRRAGRREISCQTLPPAPVYASCSTS